MSINRVFNFNITLSQLLIIASAFIAFVFNFPFLSLLYNAVLPTTINAWLFFLSVPVLLFLITIVILSGTGALFFPRFVIGMSILVSSLLFYATKTFGIIFDRAMIQNIIETNSGETLSYLNISFFLFFVFLALFPILAISKQTIRGGFSEKVVDLLKLNVVAVMGIVLIASCFYKDYAAVGRNNRSMAKYIVPYAFYNSGYKFLRDQYFYPPLPYRVLDTHPTTSASATQAAKTIVVVVGETARAANFSVNGYPRQTTPNLSQLNVVSFTNVSSCGTATAVSVPCMFSRLNREQYNNRLASSQDNALDIIHRAGIDVTWIDNNSSCKGVCDRIESITFDSSRDPTLCDGDFCLDEILLAQLQQKLQLETRRDRLIVLHMIGSHGPTYYRRYPQKFKTFAPDCPQSDIQHCSEQQLVNTYDNTIAYTDYVLSQIIKTLNDVPNAAMLYVSDHGESLGEKGLYLHGFPYSLSPEEQTHIPLIYWDSRLSQQSYKSCLQENSREPISHDNLFDSLLGLTDVQTSLYQPNLDIFKQCDAI